MLVSPILFLLPSVLVLANPIFGSKRDSSGSGSLTLPIRSRISKTTTNVADAERARIRAMLESTKTNCAAQPESSQKTVDVTNGVGSFTVSVGVGSPPTTYQLVIDTGSSITWVGANQTYVPTSTSINTTLPVSVKYGSGFFNGTEFFDILTLGPNIVVNQSIGVASISMGFEGVDGIMGIGPTDLTNGTVTGINGTFPTVVDSFFNQGVIKDEVVGIYFKPTIGDNDPEGLGELNLGGIDTTKIAGPIIYTPRTTVSPANRFWGIEQSITIGGREILAKGSTGVVDTGTTLLLLHPEAFDAYTEFVGGSLDNATGLLTVTKEKYLELPSLIFNIAGEEFELTRDAQAWPQGENEAIGGETDKIYLIVAALEGLDTSDDELDFINGNTWLQRFYSVYDTKEQRIGIAETAHTFDVVNVPNVARFPF